MIKITTKCDYCGTCVSVCPKDCIILYEHKIEINKEICIECQKCVKICPVRALKNEK